MMRKYKRIIVYLFIINTVASYEALAGGLEIGQASYSLLFEEGNYAELSGAHVRPNVTGALGAATVSNLSGRLNLLGGGVKANLGKRFDVAFQVRQPIAFDIAYPDNPFLGGLSGVNATLDATYFELLGRVKLNQNISLFGSGLYQTADGEFSLGTGPAELESDTDLGFSIGASYEILQKKVRLTLAYRSELNHESDTSIALPGRTVTTFATPRSISLDVRAPILPKTLAIASVRWSEADKANVSVDNSVLGNIFASDFQNTWRFDLSFAHRLHKKLIVLASGSYENGNGQPAGNLFPTDGRAGFQFGVRFEPLEKINITGSVGYSFLGDTTTVAGGTFNDNDALILQGSLGVLF